MYIDLVVNTCKQILYVENDPEWISTVQEVLAPPTFSVQVVTSYNHAKLRLLTSPEPFDLVIVNLCLTSENDYEGVLLVEDLATQRIPCVVLTGVLTSTRGLYDRYNVLEVLVKGKLFNKAEFRQAIQRALRASNARERSENVPRLLEAAPVPQSPRLTWLHMSDFHFRAEVEWDTEIVLKHLLQDIEGRCTIDSSLQKIDFVFVTGDVSFSGKPGEYDNAHEFLKKLGRAAEVRKDRVFIVPGNHDVDRERIPVMLRGNRPTDRSAVNGIYQDLESRVAYAARLHGFRSFVKDKYKSISLNEDLFYVNHRTAQSCMVRITGLNSAWVSGADHEYGKLILGDIQVRKALQARSSRGQEDLSIALVHHPLEWLSEFDQDDCRPLCYREFDFILHGHLHKTGMLSLQEPGRRAMVIGAGACYMARDKPNAYNYVCLDVQNRRGTVFFREYTDLDTGHWTKDTRTYRAAPDGRYDFQF